MIIFIQMKKIKQDNQMLFESPTVCFLCTTYFEVVLKRMDFLMSYGNKINQQKIVYWNRKKWMKARENYVGNKWHSN